MAGSRVASHGRGGVAGAVSGIIWGVLGPLVRMPLLLSMPQIRVALDGHSRMSLLGHLVFGVVTGAASVFLKERF